MAIKSNRSRVILKAFKLLKRSDLHEPIPVHMSLKNFLNPLSGFWQRIMPTFSLLAFDRVQSRSHTLLYRLTPNHIRSPFLGLRAKMREA
jgi:hypothetical protein